MPIIIMRVCEDWTTACNSVKISSEDVYSHNGWEISMNQILIIVAMAAAILQTGCNQAQKIKSAAPSANQATVSSSSAPDNYYYYGYGYSSGNGEYYGGKPAPGKYIRPLPPLPCQPSQASLGEITINPDHTIQGHFVNPQNCAVTTQTLTMAEFEYACYQMGRLAFAGGIYTQVKSQAPIVDEAWCRTEASTTKVGYDVAVYLDSANRYRVSAASAKLDSQGRLIREALPLTSVEDRRVVNADTISYVSEYLQLQILTRTFNSVDSTMAGSFTYSQDDDSSGSGNSYTQINIQMRCRLGGTLDVASTVRSYLIN